MKTIEQFEKEIEVLKVMLKMSETHKECLIAMHEAEKQMIIHAKTNLSGDVLREGEYIAPKLGKSSKSSYHFVLKINNDGSICKTED